MLYFAKNGFAGTKISDLAKHIGIGQGTLYIYFKSKEELFHEIFALTNSSKEIKDLKMLISLPIGKCCRGTAYEISRLLLGRCLPLCPEKIIYNKVRNDFRRRFGAGFVERRIEKELGAYMKRIAIVTGASGGMGQVFVRELIKEALDEIWVVGRNEKRLLMLKSEFGERITPICKDLTKKDELLSFSDLLKKQNPSVLWLVNNAGMARMAPSREFSFSEIEQTIDINCKAPAALINICIPFMEKGAKILNISSASAFQPVPYINLYAATKAFERSYSRALGMELKPYGITVTAVCPSWVDTDMLSKEINGKKVRFPGIVAPEKVVEKALTDAKRGKDMSICSFYVKCQHLNVKLLPQRLTMLIWLHGIKNYL